MGEILFLHVGGAGCQMGSSFWDLMYKEQGISVDGRSSSLVSPTFFSHSIEDTVSPRSIFIDLDYSPIDSIRKSRKFSPDCLISGKQDLASNFASACNNYWGEFSDRTFDQIRRSIEKCDNFQGFMFSLSISGGTGGGVTSEILEFLATEYKKKLNFTFTLFPSPQMSNNIVEPYNVLYSISKLYQFSNAVVLFDNQSCYEICSNYLNNTYSSFSDVNKLIACSISAMTSSLRHEGTVNLTMQEIVTNLIPYPNVQFLINSFAPFIPQDSQQLANTDVLTQSVFNQDYFLSSCKPSMGSYIASCLMYRGNVTPREVVQSLRSVKRFGSYIDWCPTGIKCGYDLSSPVVFDDMKNNRKTVSHLANSSCLEFVFKQILTKFQQLYWKRAFYFRYIGEGIGSGEVDVADSNIKQLCKDYNELATCSYQE